MRLNECGVKLINILFSFAQVLLINEGQLSLHMWIYVWYKWFHTKILPKIKSIPISWRINDMIIEWNEIALIYKPNSEHIIEFDSSEYT